MIKVKGQKLSTVKSYKYRGELALDDGSKSEVLSKLVPATVALT